MTLPTEPGNPISQTHRSETGVWWKFSRTFLGFFGLMFLFVALRWNSYDAPLTRDEGEYAYSAWLLEQGIAPYQNSFLQKPPMVVYTYYLSERAAPRTDWFPHIMAGIFVAWSTVVIGIIARREFGEGYGMTAMWLMTPMVLLPRLEQFTAQPEMFLLLPLVGVVAIYIFAGKQSKGWHWFGAGFLTALVLLYKFTVFPILLFTILVWSYEEWRSRGLKTVMKQWLYYSVGGLIACGPALFYFLKADGGQALWDCVIVFNRYYSLSNQFQFSMLESRLEMFWSAWWLLFLLPFVFLWRRPPRIWFWLALLAIAFASTYGSWYGHYYVPAMPFWAVVSTGAIRAIVACLPANLLIHAAWVRRLATASIVVLICLADKWPLTLTKHEFQAQVYPFTDSTVVAQKLAELTSPQDRVLVAGSEPQILYYARRLDSTRFDLMYPLMIPTPLAERYQQEAIREIEERPPAAIVRVQSNQSWLWQPSSPPEFRNFLLRLLPANYQLVGGYVRIGNQGWLAPLPPAKMGECRLLLYQRVSRKTETEPIRGFQGDSNPVFKSGR
jgi:hypothetical protein